MGAFRDRFSPIRQGSRRLSPSDLTKLVDKLIVHMG